MGRPWQMDQDPPTRLQARQGSSRIVLGWPETKNLLPVVVHFHSVVVHPIYSTFYKIGDK
ncbi:hypothetical protein BGZ52_007872, partial [Haplosporangium bisporale]